MDDYFFEKSNPLCEESLKLDLRRRLTFAERIESKDSKVLEKYERKLEPKGIIDSLCMFFDSERLYKLIIVSEILEKRKNLI